MQLMMSGNLLNQVYSNILQKEKIIRFLRVKADMLAFKLSQLHIAVIEILVKDVSVSELLVLLVP